MMLYNNSVTNNKKSYSRISPFLPVHIEKNPGLNILFLIHKYAIRNAVKLFVIHKEVARSTFHSIKGKKLHTCHSHTELQKHAAYVSLLSSGNTGCKVIPITWNANNSLNSKSGENNWSRKRLESKDNGWLITSNLRVALLLHYLIIIYKAPSLKQSFFLIICGNSMITNQIYLALIRLKQ